jgi:hypothetical protein
MSKKLIFAIHIIATMTAIGMTACNNNTIETDKNETKQEAQQVIVNYNTNKSLYESQQVDTGVFSIYVPEGWTGFQQINEKTNEVEKNSYCLIKNGTNLKDAATNPSLYIYYHENENIEKICEEAIWAYGEMLKSQITINGQEAIKYSFTSDWSEEQDETQVYKYDIIIMPIKDKGCIQFNITKETPVSSGLYADEKELESIMESVVIQ